MINTVSFYIFAALLNKTLGITEENKTRVVEKVAVIWLLVTEKRIVI